MQAGTDDKLVVIIRPVDVLTRGSDGCEATRRDKPVANTAKVN